MTNDEVKLYCDTVTKSLEKFDAKLDRVNDRYTDISARISKIETNQDNMQKDIQEIKELNNSKDNRKGLLNNSIIAAIVAAALSVIVTLLLK